MKTCIRK